MTSKLFILLFSYGYFDFKAFESHLLKADGQFLERPQHMLMRVAIAIHRDDVQSAIETYKLMSEKWFIQDSNTLLNATSTTQPVLSSSFLLTMKEDSLPGIYDTLKQTAILLKSTNDISLNIHCIRSADSYIAGSNGTSNGVTTMLKVFNEAANYMCRTDRNGNKPKELCIFLEPWHADIFEFLDLKKNTGEANLRARDLFYGLWIPDLFMQRVKENGDWSLMCPKQSAGLHEVWGSEFAKLYESYERKGKYRRQVKARDLWNAVVSSQIENGMPYMCYKDNCNSKSNQQNLGTIRCSNSSTEIVQFSSPDEIAVCQSASIALHKFVNRNAFDFGRLKEITKIVTKNLNKIIDTTFYPLPEAERSNKMHRSISIGVHGLADVFFRMRYPFESEEARKLNIQIFETIYYGALEASCELAEKDGVYETYEGSPVSKGILQYDMWNATPTDLWNWQVLKDTIKRHGIRNSLLLAPLKSVIASELLGCNHGCEPISSNITTKTIDCVNSNDSNKINLVNPYLLNDLIDRDLWNDSILEQLIHSDGSIQDIHEIPEDLKQIYKTVWEISSQKTLINMCADRAAFIDQSEALNVHISELTFDKVTSMHFYVWQKGLKSGLHHLRSIQNRAFNPKSLIKLNGKKTVD